MLVQVNDCKNSWIWIIKHIFLIIEKTLLNILDNFLGKIMKRKLKCIFKSCAAIWQDFGHLKIGSSTHNWMYLRKKNFYDSCTWYKPLGMNVANFNKIVFGAIFTVCFGCRSRIVVCWAANVCSNGKDTVRKSIWNENEIMY